MNQEDVKITDDSEASIFARIYKVEGLIKGKEKKNF